MNHKGRILADRLVAVHMAIAFNGAARLLGAILRRDHSVNTGNVKKIVVAKLIGMGSILQATPLLKALKRRYPSAQIIFVTLKSNRALLDRIEGVDEAITLDDRSVFSMGFTTLRAIFHLMALRADLYFDLEVYSAFASLLALLAVTRNRIGFYRHSTAFKKGIYTHLVFFNTRMPIRTLYLQLGQVFGVPKGESELTGPIRIDDRDRQKIPSVLASASRWQSGQPYIVVNPNASDLLLERRWPVAHAVSAITQLVSAGHQVALIGAPNERAFVAGLYDELPAEIRPRVANTAGTLSLGELCALIDGAACVLTNDTGPMHISIALARHTVCLFGPANPEHYGQKLPYVRIFYSPVFCSPCLYEADEPPCNGNNICMQRLDPAQVAAAVEQFLESQRTGRQIELSRRVDDLPIYTNAEDGEPLGVVVRTP
jgi:ADP-heptose:LPS heptosyltransferase